MEKQGSVLRVNLSLLNVQEGPRVGSYKYLKKVSLGAETRFSFFTEAVLS